MLALRYFQAGNCIADGSNRHSTRPTDTSWCLLLVSFVILFVIYPFEQHSLNQLVSHACTSPFSSATQTVYHSSSTRRGSRRGAAACTRTPAPLHYAVLTGHTQVHGADLGARDHRALVFRHGVRDDQGPVGVVRHEEVMCASGCCLQVWVTIVIAEDCRIILLRELGVAVCMSAWWRTAEETWAIDMDRCKYHITAECMTYFCKSTYEGNVSVC